MSIIIYITGDVSLAVTEVAKIAAEPFVAGGLENFHIVEHPAGHVVLKKLIANDKQRMSEGKECEFFSIAIDIGNYIFCRFGAHAHSTYLLFCELLKCYFSDC